MTRPLPKWLVAPWRPQKPKPGLWYGGCLPRYFRNVMKYRSVSLNTSIAREECVPKLLTWQIFAIVAACALLIVNNIAVDNLRTTARVLSFWVSMAPPAILAGGVSSIVDTAPKGRTSGFAQGVYRCWLLRIIDVNIQRKRLYEDLISTAWEPTVAFVTYR